MPPDFDYTNQEELLAQMPDNIKARLSEKNSPKRMMSLIGWKLLLDNLQESNLLSKVEFEEKGKPYIPNSDVHFNISNTKGAVLVAIHNAPIGVDLERLREPRENIYNRVFCEEEKEFITCAEDFTRLWTRKESVVKLFGGGISMGLPTFSVLEDEIKAFERRVKIEGIEVEGFIAHAAFYLGEPPY